MSRFEEGLDHAVAGVVDERIDAAPAGCDTGDGGLYGNLEASWSKPLGESSFFEVKAGTSWTEDYYASSGWHDLYARLGWTYAFNDSVAVTPFAGTSIPMSSGPERNRLYAGLWFEVNF